MFKAKITDVTKRDDDLTIKVEFTDGVKTFEKDYPFVHMVDINSSFDETIKNELKRIDDLETGYQELKAKIGVEITSIDSITK